VSETLRVRSKIRNSTVGVKFIASEGKGNAFVPEAGKMYNARVGEMKI
jgi:hypothetical protein